MPEYQETYNEMVTFQQFLDERFPDGAYYAEMIEREDGSLLPSGLTGSVGRVLVFSADVDEEGWWYGVMLDFNRREDLDDPANWFHPLVVRVRELLETEVPDLYEGVALGEGDFVRVVRFHAKPAGPRTPPPGHREWLTERWESTLFPEGLQLMGVASE